MTNEEELEIAVSILQKIMRSMGWVDVREDGLLVIDGAIDITPEQVKYLKEEVL